MSNIELGFVATLAVLVAPPVIVDSRPDGVCRVVPITGGHVSGPRLNGVIVSAGADFQIVREDGSTMLRARYSMTTDDGASIAIDNAGIRHGPPALMQRLLRGEMVDPNLIYFRTIPRFDTTHPDYRWMMRSLFVGTGRRFPDRVEIDVFEVR